MKQELKNLRISQEDKVRPKKTPWAIFGLVSLAAATAVYFAIPREGDDVRVKAGTKAGSSAVKPAAAANSNSQAVSTPSAPATVAAGSRDVPGAAVLTVSGYIIARERIELSPRFMGMVKWIGVKKGDSVTNNQVLVLLDDSEYRARLQESQGRLAAAQANLEKAILNFDRVSLLASNRVESQQVADDMRLNVAAGQALVKEIEGQVALTQTYVDWCVIRSPINGVVLEKLVDPNELVTPQSFGGTRGPSTALVALADLKDLQVEIDLNEGDVAKVKIGQKCRVSPEAYPERTYEGYVAEKAPEAARQKGTLQVKVQIKDPDEFLTPELSAKVEFLAESSKL